MNKMVKGTMAIGAGAFLLLGGGSTLAVWNAQVEAGMGVVSAGNLDLATGTGSWSSNISGPIADIDEYLIVPGETLTYKQTVDVTLEGDSLAAKLSVVNSANMNKGFDEDTFAVSQVALTGPDGKALPATLKDSAAGIKAAVTFEFKSETSGRESTNAAYDFSDVAFKLEQVPVEGATAG